MSGPCVSELSDKSRVDAEFSVRIVVCNHYLAKPVPGVDVIYSDFRGSDIKQVPVLRIFGPTPGGRKACVHIHGVFPYFYIPCPTPNPEPQYLYQIAASLDKALNIALKQATSTNQHVYKISLVKGLPFYGFHDKEHLYLKVFLYSPGLIKQAVELCSNGAILGQSLQPHESHLNFTLQFFIDFNLFGMSNIDLQAVRFRKSGLQSSTEPFESSCDSGLKPESSCFYEVDCSASHIINRQRISKGDGIENPGLEEVWNQEKERRKQLNMSLAAKSLSQGRITPAETESHHKFEQMFLMKSSNLIDKPVNVEEGFKPPAEVVYYPAESLEGSQLFNAVDISVHLPDSTLGVTMSESLRRDLDETLVDDQDNTIVDESLALNCSLHYSQVLLNSEDLELVDMLQDMEERPVEDDSVMATPVEEHGSDDDDAEYSQVYNDETILLNVHDSKGDTSESSPYWNDSFWDGANIPQLDGTFDDDHVKKVRKRKMRPFKLGLSRPKAKKNDTKNESQKDPDETKMDTSEIDEINASRDTIDDISDLHLRRAIKLEPKSILENSQETQQNKNLNRHLENQEPLVENMSLIDLVNKVSRSNDKSCLEPSKAYDVKNNFMPLAGPSVIHNNKRDILRIPPMKLEDDSMIDTDSSQEDKGIMSFYASKIFDSSIDIDSSRVLTEEKLTGNIEKEEDIVVKNNITEVDITDKDVMLESPIVKNDLKTIEVLRLKILTPKIKPPTKKDVISSLDKYKIPKVIPKVVPYYSDPKDVGDKVEIGQMILKLQSKSSRDQKPFEKVLDTISIEEWRQLLFLQTNEMSQESSKPEVLKRLLAGNKTCILEPVIRPPAKHKVIEWVKKRNSGEEKIKVDHDISKNVEELDNSQALGLHEDEINSSISLETYDKDKPNLDNTMQVTMQPDGSFLCFGGSHQKETSSIETTTVDVNFLTVMLIEVHTSIRRDFNPDPMQDAIQAVFIKITNDSPPNHPLPKSITEILVVDDMSPPKYLDRCIFNVSVNYVNTECDIIERVIDVVKTHDPDIMCGYEIEMNSWGYLMERAQFLGLEIVKDLSRITEKHRQKRWRSDENDFEGRIIGRVMFNVWRLFRHELALSSYSFENCMYEIIKERVPKYSFAQLSEWWCDESRILRWIPVEYYLTRLSGTVRMLEKLDIINRTSELARLFGLQWWEVLSRGSQFRVESLMLRAARPLNLVALSPTVKQRAAMRAPECLPLIFEPESRFYTDPVIVLDFQSLYPSMMIAYNYCFSTCIGRVQNITGDTAYEFGAWRLRIPKTKLDNLVKQGLVHWSPVGVGFVKPAVRRGVLPALLRRILAARQAVKATMKVQTDEGVKKALHSRQLGLKLIANVTYGYTAANFSGRMPCVEVGDSVVAKGRETLERAIKLVRSNSQWRVKVVYGDTDSMFVLVPGASRSEAFEVGQQIADAVTADNPSPVALKLEKVYQPCILQTKKRYVGYMYESADQEKPMYEAKGIETVRRDGCPAGVKLLQRALCTLFDTGDMSCVKRTVTSLLSRLVDGSLPPAELFFTREYHGAAGYRPGATAPPNEIAKRITSRDRRATPRSGERVSWLVTAGAPAVPLVRLARTPSELVKDPTLTPHVSYYAARVLLPPLHRCLSLLGADVFKWWAEVGYNRESKLRELARTGGIARYLSRERCAVCGARGHMLCATCSETRRAAIPSRGGAATVTLLYCDQWRPRIGKRTVRRPVTRRSDNTTARPSELTIFDRIIAYQQICSTCSGHAQLSCENTECPVLWRRLVARQNLCQVQDIVAHLPTEFNAEAFDF